METLKAMKMTRFSRESERSRLYCRRLFCGNVPHDVSRFCSLIKPHEISCKNLDSICRSCQEKAEATDSSRGVMLRPQAQEARVAQSACAELILNLPKGSGGPSWEGPAEGGAGDPAIVCFRKSRFLHFTPSQYFLGSVSLNIPAVHVAVGVPRSHVAAVLTRAVAPPCAAAVRPGLALGIVTRPRLLLPPPHRAPRR